MLVAAAAAWAHDQGATSLFLEVGVDNEPAIALYEGLGFERVGRRAGYYTRADGEIVDAIVMRRALDA